MPSDWNEPDFPSRVIASWDGSVGASALLRLPPEFSTNTAVRVYDNQGWRVPAWVASSVSADRWVWIATQSEGEQYAAPLRVYYSGPDADEPPETRAAIADADTWRVEVFRASGVGIPDTLERMLFIRRQAGNARHVFFIDHLDLLTSEQVSEGRAVLRAATHLLVEREGAYRFALKCRNTAFVFLDGQPVCAWLREGDSGDWVAGRPINLIPGVYELTVYNYYVQTDDPHPLEIGWQVAEDDPAPVPIPAAARLAAGRLDVARSESLNQVLHPGFNHAWQPAYRVYDTAPTFVPVRFRQSSANWSGNKVDYLWEFGDGAKAEGASVTHVFTNTGVANVKLTVCDGLGNEASVRQELRLEPLRLRESRLAAAVAGVPAALFSRDRINPALEISGDFEGRSLDVGWRLDMHGQPSRSAATNVTPTDQATLSIPLSPEIEATAVSGLAWRVSHAGAVLLSGKIDFLQPPFGVSPASVDADRLLVSEGNRIVWITDPAPRSPFPRPRPAGGARNKYPAVWLTDAPAAFPSRNMLRVQPARLWGDAPEVAGPMVKIIDVIDLSREAPHDLMLGLGHFDYLKGVEVGVFERQISALTEWLLELDNVNLFWSTPLPLSSDPSGIRPYAAAVRRVADSRGVPVADLYSYIMGAPDRGAAWVQPAPLIGLTPAGVQMALRVAAETMKP